MRKCKSCNIDKIINDFPIANTIKGKVYRRYSCNACYIKKKKERTNITRNNLLIYKKNLKCEICGFSDFRALQFHHLNNKKFNLSELGGRSLTTMYTEISKCKVLCANCHQIEHFMKYTNSSIFYNSHNDLINSTIN